MTHHEGILVFCDDLKFQAVANVYADMTDTAETAAKQESLYIEYLEQVLKAENDLRQGRSRHTLAKWAGFPTSKPLNMTSTSQPGLRNSGSSILR